MELSRNLRVDSVSRLEPAPPQTIAVDQTVAQAVTLLREANVGCLLVTQQRLLVGIFTERDLLTRILWPGVAFETAIGQVMTPQPVTVSPKDSVRTAIKRMQKGGYRHLPVVDEVGRPVGVLSVRRVVHYLVEHFPELVFNLPPDPSRFPETPDGA